MNVKAENAICLNLSDEVIYNVIGEEKAEKIRESVYDERFDE
jgi:hypothetical protein